MTSLRGLCLAGAGGSPAWPAAGAARAIAPPPPPPPTDDATGIA